MKDSEPVIIRRYDPQRNLLFYEKNPGIYGRPVEVPENLIDQIKNLITGPEPVRIPARLEIRSQFDQYTGSRRTTLLSCLPVSESV